MHILEQKKNLCYNHINFTRRLFFMNITTTVGGVKSFKDKKILYLLQTTKSKLLFAKEHTHTFYEIVFIIEGRCIHKISEKSHDMTTGDFIIVPPRKTHGIISADKGTDILIISISKDEYSKYELLYGASLADRCENHPKLVNLPLQTRRAVIELLQGENIHTDHNVRAICSLLFSGYADIIDKTWCDIPRSLTMMIEKIKLDIVLQREGVEAMTRLAGYSISQLTRLMERYYATTPHEFIKNLRLSTARKLVSETNISLESISHECGYNCYGYFTTIFKQNYGITPAAYRKQKARITPIE